MPAKRNEEAVKEIIDAARDIMMEEGYEAMTYTELAKQTGLPRGSVQYYFPRKEILATMFMKAVAELASNRARVEMGDDAEPLTVVFAASQIVIGMYYTTPGMRQFMLDVSSSRKTQHAVSPDWSDWLRKMTGNEDLTLTRSQLDDLLRSNGADHEMHFVYLSDGRTPRFSDFVHDAILVEAKVLGIKKREAERMMKAGLLSQERTQQIATELIEQLAHTDIDAA